MIDAAAALLDRDDLPSWEDDAATRRELERMAEDLHRYAIAARCDAGRAARIAHDINLRARRINAFLTGRRCGGQAANGWGMKTRGHAHEV